MIVVDDEDLSFGKVLLTEYEQLKQEQRARIGYRDKLVYLTLAATAAVIAAILQSHGQLSLLLLLPPVSLLLGWTYFSNDEKISSIGDYILHDLSARVSVEYKTDVTEVFGWEMFHRSDARRRVRKGLQLAVDLLTFCVIPFAALIAVWTHHSMPCWLGMLSVVEAALVAVLAAQIVYRADIG